MIVVDASIATKWYLNEPGSAEAASILTSAAVLMAPALIRVEVTGAIIRRWRENKLSLKRAREACALWDADLAGGAAGARREAPRPGPGYCLPDSSCHSGLPVPRRGPLTPAAPGS
jgi:hypothetical protein